MQERKEIHITPQYAIDNNLMPLVEGVSKAKTLRILNEYGKEVKKRLIENEGYCIMTIVKQMNISLKRYTRNAKEDLVLRLETKDGKLNRRIVRIKPTFEFKQDVHKVPSEKRYLFTKV